MTQASTLSLRLFAASLLLTLGACDVVQLAPDTVNPKPPEPGLLAPTLDGPAGAAEGTCWGKTVSPAVIQTVTRQVLVKSAQFNSDGTVATAPSYRSESLQEIVTPRQDNWFETPCPNALTPEFTATLQRALQARGAYIGLITSEMDPATLAAVQNFQRAAGGPNSSVLTLETARTLGLIAVARAPSE